METRNIRVLIQECSARLNAAGYSASRISWHERKWENGICRFLSKLGTEEYSRDLGEQYLQGVIQGVPYNTAKSLKRNINILTEYLEHGTISSRKHDFTLYPLDGEIGKLAEAFLQEQEDKRLRPRTIAHHRRFLSLFISSLSIKNKESIHGVTAEDVLDFLNATEVQERNRKYTMRSFFRFLVEKKLVNASLYMTIGTYKCVQKDPLPSYYTEEEIAAMEKSIHCDTPTGIRDYAIFMVACRLGLRASDIARLGFDNLDWVANKIHLFQEKTGKEVVLPLTKPVGEALVQYIRYGRSKLAAFNTVFCTVTEPCRSMNTESINSVVRRIMKNAGIRINGRHFGPHSLRHSLASRMLLNGTPLPIISETLGHSSTQTTMAYLRIDERQLRECTLDVPLVEKDFYEQKGGLFYE